MRRLLMDFSQWLYKNYAPIGDDYKWKSLVTGEVFPSKWIVTQFLTELERKIAAWQEVKIPEQNIEAVLETLQEGITLRDQLAMAALPGLIEKYGKTLMSSKWAYEIADEMLKARKQEGGES